MLETLLGGFFGGVFRLVPEVMKWLDRKDERKHELDMLQAEMEVTKLRGELALRHADIEFGEKELDAVKEAYKEQSETAAAAGKFVSGISALVRPLVTYWFVILYSGVKIATMTQAYALNGSWQEMFITCWNTQDMAILNFILVYWFVGRTVRLNGNT